MTGNRDHVPRDGFALARSHNFYQINEPLFRLIRHSRLRGVHSAQSNPPRALPMLTPADEYLIHQTPFTFDHVYTSDRNFYDRYFFNGYRRDGEVYFAMAMGAYPNLGVF